MLLTLNFPRTPAVKTYVNGQLFLTNNTTTAIAAVQTNVDANEAATNTAIALKKMQLINLLMLL